MNNIIDCIKDEKNTHICDTKLGVLLVRTENFLLKDKFAMFDLDGTIISNRSGKKFFNAVDDWKLRDNVKVTLQKYNKSDYSIIIISNQTGLWNNDSRREMFISRLHDIISELQVPICFLASIKCNILKKPSPAIYNKIILKLKIPKKVFYCGDAAGRTSDFSDSDIKFAMNNLIKFYLPEHIFGWDKNATYPDIQFKQLEFNTHEFQYKRLYKKELILMIGFPASGKSTIVDILHKFHGFTVASNDIHKRFFVNMLDKYINSGDDIVIDNTNLSRESREKIIIPARNRGYNIRAFVMDTTYDQCIHNNFYRSYTTKRELIPLSAYRFMKNKFEYPNKSEDIDSVEKIKHIFLNTFEYTHFFPES
jgi:bifunctional polynucleotide phosphatase/kinase